MSLQVSWPAIQTFRWRQHSLDRQYDDGVGPPSLLDLAARGGLKDSPPGQAALSIFARGGQLLAKQLDHALFVDRSMLLTWSLRGSPLIFPLQDTALFTQALLPDSEEAWLHFLPGVQPLLPDLDLSFTELVGLARPALADVFSRQPAVTGKSLLDSLLADTIALSLPNHHLRAWQLPSGLAAEQTTGQALASFLLRPLALEGRVCQASRLERHPRFVDPAVWLGQPDWLQQLQSRRLESRPALVRRYLQTFGPATLHDCAAWTGLPAIALEPAWNDVLADCVSVSLTDKNGHVVRGERWLPADRVDDLLASAPNPPDKANDWQERPIIQLLPAGDPYLLMPDRDRLLPEPHWRRQVWQAAGSPGVVLQNGRIIGLWRHRQLKSTLRLSIRLLEPYADNRAALLSGLTDQAFDLANFWQLQNSEICWEKPD